VAGSRVEAVPIWWIESVAVARQDEVDTEVVQVIGDVSAALESADSSAVSEGDRPVEVRRVMHHRDVQVGRAKTKASNAPEQVGGSGRVG
jgi:hypothetical protein